MKLFLAFACAVLSANIALAAPSPEPANGAVPAASAPLTVEDFYKDPVLGSGQLSPNGRYLAYFHGPDHPGVLITDLQTSKVKGVLGLSKDGVPVKGMHVDWIRWKGNDRILVGVSLVDLRRLGGRPDTEIMHASLGQYIVAIDRESGAQVQLLGGDKRDRLSGAFVDLLDALRKDPAHVLVVSDDPYGGARVYRVDVRTGQGQVIDSAGRDIIGWTTDEGGNVVIRARRGVASEVIEGRSPGETDWTLITRVVRKDRKTMKDFEFLGPTEKPGEFYVAVQPKTAAEGEFRTLRTFDIKTRTLSEPIWRELGRDIESVLYEGDSYRLTGVCFTTDVQVCDFKDPNLTSYFKGVANHFQNQRSIVPISISDDGQWWLFDVSGPNERSGYYLLDWKTRQLDFLGSRYPSLPEDKLGKGEKFVYAARDGVSIPSYLLRPANDMAADAKGRKPLVVMPHGGPESRDFMAYDTWGQIYASRGYFVFKPNFRGSRGYGKSWMDAGARQWNGRMADDITDGVKALIAKGEVDPDRICIAGASYGGYAALLAGAKHPELYKCVVSWAGISDLSEMLKTERAIFDGGEAYHFWVGLIGDPATDKPAIIAASPITYAASYQPPVLLVHGKDDDIVDQNQSIMMETALRRAGKSVQLSLYGEEGHPEFDTKENAIRAYNEMAAFVDKYLARPGPAAAARP